MSRQMIDSADIVSIHRAFAAGQSQLSIALQTFHARNTVHKHLAGEYKYPPDLQAKVDRIRGASQRALNPRRRAPAGWMTLHEAIAQMPHQPTYGKAYQYVRARLMKAKVINGITCTKPGWLEDFLRYHCRLPECGLGCFRPEAWALLVDPPTPAFWKSLRCRWLFVLEQIPIAHAFDVREAAERAGLEFLDRDQTIVRAAREADERFVLLRPRIAPKPKAEPSKPVVDVAEAARQFRRDRMFVSSLNR